MGEFMTGGLGQEGVKVLTCVTGAWFPITATVAGSMRPKSLAPSASAAGSAEKDGDGDRAAALGATADAKGDAAAAAAEP